MGGMFTLLKVRDGLTSYADPGWYSGPKSELADLASEAELKRDGITPAAAAAASVTYSCPMHPEIVRNAPGKCPICGMTLVKHEASASRGAERG
jgi:Heavy metal binding domain